MRHPAQPLLQSCHRFLAPSPRTPAPLLGRVTGAGGPKSQGSRHRPRYAATLPSINTPAPPTPPSDPGRAPGLRAGARPGDRPDRDRCVKEGDGQTSLGELLSCARVRARGPQGTTPGGWGSAGGRASAGRRSGPSRSPLELRRLPPPLPPPPPGECSGVCPVEPPYQSRPLLQRRRRHSSAASAAALCSPSSAAAPQPPASAARTPRAAATLCRPLGPRPRPPRRAGRRLRLRAVDAAATDADASSSAPPSFSLKANKHHGGGRRPPPHQFLPTPHDSVFLLYVLIFKISGYILCH